MHADERESVIMERLETTGFLAFHELDTMLEASAATLRRDLDRLASQGRLVRVRGGARLVPREGTASLTGVPFHENVARHHAQKNRIGQCAAALCRPGEAVIIDGGSTTLEMCAHVAPLGLHVLTNSLHIVSALQHQPNTRVSLPAGALFREQNIVLSPYDDDGMSSFRASKLFIGAAAIGEHGPMQADVLLIQAERRLLSRAAEIILLVDSSKFGETGGHILCPLEEIDTIISDGGLARRYRDMITAADVQLLIA